MSDCEKQPCGEQLVGGLSLTGLFALIAALRQYGPVLVEIIKKVAEALKDKDEPKLYADSAAPQCESTCECVDAALEHCVGLLSHLVHLKCCDKEECQE